MDLLNRPFDEENWATEMKLRKNVFVVGVLLFLLSGCSTPRDRIALSPVPEDKVGERGVSSENRDLIVLLPDPDSKAGGIRVTTKGGSQILDKPGYATQVEDFTKPPIDPRPIEEKEIAAIFGAALSAQPDLTDRFVSFILWFKNDKTELTPRSKELLKEIVRTIKSRRPNEIFVAGHTDRMGTESHNVKLSYRRACYIRDFLASSGLEPRTFVVSFHGEAMPLVYTEDEVAEPLNRRVEVLVR